MKKKLLYSITLMAALCMTSLPASSYTPVTTSSENQQESDDTSKTNDYKEGEAIVLLSDTAKNEEKITEFRSSPNSKTYLAKDIVIEKEVTADGISDSLKEQQSKTEEESTSLSMFSSEKETVPGDRIAVVSSESMSTKELINYLITSKKAYYAEPNYTYSLLENDSYFSSQWANNSDSHLASDNSSDRNDIHLQDVPEKASDSNIVVLMDSGIDNSHEDLKNSLLNSYSFNTFDGSSYTSDENGHGTFCAGIIAAETNNSTGIAGVSSQTKIISVKVMDGNGDGDSFNVISGMNTVISYLKSGLKIRAINMSFGGMSNSAIVNSQIKQAGELGAASICAAGNDSKNLDTTPVYPASFDNPYIIRVASSTASHTLSPFSNYGSASVDVAAPGSNIVSTYPIATYTPYLCKDNYYEDFDSLTTGTSYGTASSSTAVVTEDKNFNHTTTGKKGKSICWSINATAGKSYTYTLPKYTTDGKTIPYAGFETLIESDNPNAATDYSPLTFHSSVDKIPLRLGGIYAKDAREWSLITNAKLTSSQSGNIVFTFQPKHSGSYRIYLDCVGVGYKKVKYTEMSGTSMAAPYVSGETARLANYFPTEDILTIISRVKGGVDTWPALADKISSKGSINIQKAVQDPSPVINEITLDGTDILLHGLFFGTSENASVTVNGQTLPIRSWTNNCIRLDGSSLTSGNFTITVTTPKGSYTLKKALVFPVFASKITLNKTKATAFIGKSLKLSASAAPLNASQNFTWKSSKPSYASVSSAGTVKAKKKGRNKTVKITVSTTDGTNLSAVCKVTIKQPVTKIKLNKTTLTAKAGKKIKLTATVQPKNASSKKIKWSISNKKYASVSKKGVVTLKKKGKNHTVTVTAKATDGSGKKKKCKIKIK